MAKWKKNTTLTYEGENEIEFNSANLGNFYIGKPSPLPPDAKRVGGRIFYGHLDNQANYRFFTEDKTEIKNWSVPEEGGLPIGLDNAYYYTSDKAEGVADRFYVFNNELKTRVQWGKFTTSIGITADGIGRGKSNTKKALTKDTGTEWELNSIFKYISDFNGNNETGCDDWYIGSKAEQNKLVAVEDTFGINWYNNRDGGGRYIWSSVEDTSSNSYRWNYLRGSWNFVSKNYVNDHHACLAMRSF